MEVLKDRASFDAILGTYEKQEEQQQPKKLVVVFSAAWCKSCEKFSKDLSLLPDASLLNGAYKWVKVDVDEIPDLAEEYQVVSLPTLIKIGDGNGTNSRYTGSEIDKAVVWFNDMQSLASSDGAGGGNLALVPIEPIIPLISTDLCLNLANSLPNISFDVDLSTNAPSAITFQLLDKINLGDLRFSAQEIVTLNSAVAEVLQSQEIASTEFSNAEVQKLYVYKVPTVSSDGTCSNVSFMAKRPFNIASDGYKIADVDVSSDNSLTERSCERLRSHPMTLRLFNLYRIVDRLYDMTGAEWIGIYRLIATQDAVSAKWGPCLMKEAYKGEPSRALFPVSESFASKSTNSWVGLNGSCRIIANTRKREEGVSYYECSGSVQSELCVPILRARTIRGGYQYDIVGIIDLESWKVDHFDAKKVLNVLKVAMDLGNSTSFFI